MRSRGKAAVYLGAILLSVSFASHAPLADGPKQKKWVPEIEGLTPKQVKKYQKIGLVPKYEPLGLRKTGKLAKLLKKLKQVKPEDYQLDEVQKIIDNNKDNIIDMKINKKGIFKFKIKPIKLKNGKMLSGDVKIEGIESREKKLEKEKEPLWRITFYISNKKGKWFCGTGFKKLAKEYKKRTGEELEQVAYGMKKKKNGDFDFYIIPVSSFEDAKKGKIKADVPFLLISYKADKDGFYAHGGRNIHNIVDGPV